jgi:hypothetical protein
VSSQALVRYKTNDYSVPVAYGHRNVWVRGLRRPGGDGCGGDIVARHPRGYDREDMVFDPVHYLPLIEKKINGLDQAAPLAGWELPAEFQTLRRLMEAWMIKAGWRECRSCGSWRPSTSTVSALSIPYAARLDDSWKRQGMSSSIRLWGWPSRIARRVSAT